MKTLRFKDPGFADAIRQLTAASSLFDPIVESRAREIVDAVRQHGDAALIEFTKRFDGADLATEQLQVTRAELLAAALKADQPLRDAIALADNNVATFARKSRRKNWSAKNTQGAMVGEKFDPFQRVGIYIPGGTAPLVSTALMTITLARVAGCPEIIVCTPCNQSGEINPALLHAVNAAGATEIYRIGGAQAIAAMSLGTSTIRKVQKVFGPGNAYVVAAKRLLFGHVAIDLLPGPSEVLVMADESADPKYAAADVLAQAEHGSGHERVWVTSASAKVLTSVEREITWQLKSCTRRDYIEKALSNNGWLIQVESTEDAINLANQLAPEHCEIMMKGPEKIAARIITAGALFLGNLSPTVMGDYVAGPSHTLPTGGAGSSFAGLTVDQFQRRTSVVKYDKPSLRRSFGAVSQFARMEGLDAHGRSAAIRLKK